MNETYECPKCNGKLTLPADIDEQVQVELAEACRGTRKVEAMLLIREKLNIGLGECKCMIWLISGLISLCGRCGHKLLESGVIYCPACSSLNLNW